MSQNEYTDQKLSGYTLLSLMSVISLVVWRSYLVFKPGGVNKLILSSDNLQGKFPLTHF